MDDLSVLSTALASVKERRETYRWNIAEVHFASRRRMAVSGGAYTQSRFFWESVANNPPDRHPIKKWACRLAIEPFHFSLTFLHPKTREFHCGDTFAGWSICRTVVIALRVVLHCHLLQRRHFYFACSKPRSAATTSLCTCANGSFSKRPVHGHFVKEARARCSVCLPKSRLVQRKANCKRKFQKLTDA